MHSFAHSSTNSFIGESEFPEQAQGPPPVPPPHSVPLSSLKRDKSFESFDESLNNRKGIVSDRTPSPLRHAMDDVMSSLNNLELLGTPANSPTKEEPPQTPAHRMSTTERQSPYTKTGHQVNPSMDRKLSTLSNLNGIPNSDFDRNIYASEQDNVANTPFDPNSYNSPSASPTHQNLYNVNVSRTTSYNSMYPDRDVTRTDTYKSCASDVTNEHSVFSESTTPTEFSNSSTSSAGSSQNMRSEIRYKMEGVPGLSNSISHSIETPVTLPKARQQSKSPYKSPQQTSPQRSIKLKKSAGFIKKFFSNAAGNYNSPNAQKSHHERANSSLSFRGAVRKVSGKSFSGRTALSSQDLYPTTSGTSFKPSGETDKWIEVHRNVHRTNTLTKNEKAKRKMRPQIDGIRSLEPIDDLSRIAGNETGSGGYTLRDNLLLERRDFSVVWANISSLNSWPYRTPGDLARGHILQKFSDPLDQLRCAFDFCSTKLKWEGLVSDDALEEGVGSLTRTMQSRRASCQDIANAFKQMCDALSIYCDVIPGYLKGPGEVWHNPGIPRVNHYWNAVLVDDHWRMVDASLASPSFPTRDIYSKCDKRSPEYFYFLTKPCELVYTHVPYSLRDEHIVPALPHDVLIALPVAGPMAFNYSLVLKDFSTSLTRMQGLDVAELTVAVTPEVEIFGEVMAGTFPAGSAHLLLNTDDHKKFSALSQVFWENGERFCRIKAVLPPTHEQGALSLYVGPRGTLQSITKNTLSLAYSVPMIQKGENPALNFVIRHPTPHSDHQDIYINEPQCRDFVYGQTYVFAIRQHPSKGNVRSNGKVAMAIQTPTGRIIKLHKSDNMGKPYGLWEGNVKCVDVGTWRGLILSDTGNAWSVYAEWHCA